MIPYKLDITIYRGVTFSLELIAQVKVYAYTPAVDPADALPADRKRTHLENLTHYGFNYAYVDFATDYADAELRIIKPWVKSGQAATTPLMTMSKGSEIELTDKSVKLLLDGVTTKEILFNEGTYELLLTKINGTIDGLIYGNITVLGDK